VEGELCVSAIKESQGKELPHARFGGQVKAVPARDECVWCAIACKPPKHCMPEPAESKPEAGRPPQRFPQQEQGGMW
jgi:hypothetical protein